MKLSRPAFERAAEFLRHRARPLERELFAHAFEGAAADRALAELQKFANDDGGFGNGLEPDLRVPDSSGLATSHALTILGTLGARSGHPMVSRALAWLERSFDPTCSAWRAVPPNVDDHPRAPHWSAALHAPGGGWPVEVIPCAEVLAHFFDHRSGAPAQLEAATAALVAALPDCAPGADGVLYLDRLARARPLPKRLAEALSEHLPRIARDLVECDAAKWGGYVASPLKLAPTPRSTVAELFPEAIDRNLDWAIEQQRPDGSWAPNWTWQGAFPEVWEVAHREWQGVLTLERLESFRAYGRLGA